MQAEAPCGARVGLVVSAGEIISSSFHDRGVSRECCEQAEAEARWACRGVNVIGFIMSLCRCMCNSATLMKHSQ